jgi:starch-binding outer membrane protein, SusD/RagB family
MTIMERGARMSRMLSIAVAAVVGLSACDILDVNNPNSLLEEDIRKPAAANALVNGTLSLVSGAVSAKWQEVGIVADELVWIGSRDAWQQLDFGFISDPYNEFTDGNFPLLGRARWQADEAEKILLEHSQTITTPQMRRDLARAHLYAGTIYMIIGEIQQDFAFSNKTEGAPAVGAAKMSTVLDQAIQKLDKAVAAAQAANDANLQTVALATRARARHSRAIWDKMKAPSSAPLVNAAGAVSDAQAVLGRVSGDWSYKYTFSAATIANDMASWINSRGENQFDTASVVRVNPANTRQIQAVKLMDPIDNVPDPVITARLREFKGGNLTATGDVYPPLTVTSARLMHLILAEDALQKNNQADFRTHINNIRAMDGLTPYTGQIPAMDMLRHTRRVNLFLMGLRLNDMYRFGIRDPHWRPNSDAFARPGTLLPITIIEIRANPHLTPPR